MIYRFHIVICEDRMISVCSLCSIYLYTIMVIIAISVSPYIYNDFAVEMCPYTEQIFSIRNYSSFSPYYL